MRRARRRFLALAVVAVLGFGALPFDYVGGTAGSAVAVLAIGLRDPAGGRACSGQPWRRRRATTALAPGITVSVPDLPRLAVPRRGRRSTPFRRASTPVAAAAAALLIVVVSSLQAECETTFFFEESCATRFAPTAALPVAVALFLASLARAWRLSRRQRGAMSVTGRAGTSA